MTSTIDATKPGEGQAYTADVRTNFARASDEISDLQARVLALESKITSIGVGTWRWLTSPVSGSIASGRVGLDADTSAAATTVWITSASDDGSDYSPAFIALAPGDGLLIWDRQDTTNQMRFSVTAAASNFGTYFTIPVALLNALGVEPANNADANVQMLFQS